MTPAPYQYQVVILGAGRNVRGHLPSAMVNVSQQGRVLDWLLMAFSVLPDARVHFVSGYMASAVMDQYPDINFLYNPVWEVTGPAKSLALAPLSSAVTNYVSYSDVVFRPESVRRMEALKTDLVMAVDTRWQTRYEGRGRAELDGSEKVICEGDRLIDVGKDIPTSEAVAEFAGLMKMSAGRRPAHGLHRPRSHCRPGSADGGAGFSRHDLSRSEGDGARLGLLRSRGPR